MRINVLGAVHQQGRFHLDDGSTILDAVASAGGLNVLGQSVKIVVRRRGEKGVEILATDFNNIVTGRDDDIGLHEGDTIFLHDKA